MSLSPGTTESPYLQTKNIPVGRLCIRGRIHRSGGSCQRRPCDLRRYGIEAAVGGAPVDAEESGLRGLDVTSDGAVPRLAHELASGG